MDVDLLHDALSFRLLSDAACRVLVMLHLNNPTKIHSLRLVRELSGVARPGRCLRELADAQLILLSRGGYRGRKLEMERLPAADFRAWRMELVPEQPDKMQLV